MENKNKMMFDLTQCEAYSMVNSGASPGASGVGPGGGVTKRFFVSPRVITLVSVISVFGFMVLGGFL